MSNLNLKQYFRASMLLLMLAVLVGSLLVSLYPTGQYEGTSYLGVPVLETVDEREIKTYQYRDYSEHLTFRGEYVPVDQRHGTIYLSQNMDSLTGNGDINGKLSVDLPGRMLYFAPDEAWENIPEAIQNGHRFRLLITDRSGTYMQYDVIFTRLPVISMYGELLYKDTEGRNVLSGQLRVWDPDGSVLSSRVQWHVRGKTSSGEDKKPWKLSLKNKEGKNRSENILGLGADDDWILNAMNMEDTDVREMLFMDLWNEVAADTAYNSSMSTGRYAELLINGEYHGLYLLQRRIDSNYLELSAKDVLVKGIREAEVTGYEQVSSYAGDERQRQLLEAFFTDSDYRMLSVPNFIDVNLFMQMFCARDNSTNKNMYYLFSGAENGYRISLIPWDTDMAFGIEWDPVSGGFIYRYDNNLQRNVLRQEMGLMQQLYPDLHQQMSIRWKELRETVFSQEYIYEKIGKYCRLLDESGAPARDYEKWGFYYEGEDTVENLYRFIDGRLQYLDGYYQ